MGSVTFSRLLIMMGIEIERTLAGDVDDVTDAYDLFISIILQVVLAMAGGGCVLQS